MRAAESWTPTKFEPFEGSWRASRDPRFLSPASMLVAERIAVAYTRSITRHATGDLVDLGCGMVPLYGAYRDLVTSVTCVDWPNTMHPSPYLDLEADLTQPLPLPDAAYDTVLLTDVLEHLPRPDAIWAEIRRILRPGGVVIVGVPFLYWLHEQPHDYHRYTNFRLQMFADDHGFEVVELAPYGGPTDVAADMIAKILNSKPRWRWLVPRVMRWAEKRGRGPYNIRINMPLGYVMVARRDDLPT